MRKYSVSILPASLQPIECVDLVRLGRRHDGGYLVSKSDVGAADILLSFGVNDDWSFEKAFREISGCGIAAYDASINRGELKRRAIRACWSIWKPQEALRKFRKLEDYERFFQGDIRHIEKFIGAEEFETHASFTGVMEEFSPRQAFLKVDIEGAEYEILDDILSVQDDLVGLAIEFHDCAENLGKICDFVDQFRLQLVHLHPNNFGGLSPSGTPNALELTFSKHGDMPGKKAKLPHLLDMRNSNRRRDIRIQFS